MPLMILLLANNLAALAKNPLEASIAPFLSDPTIENWLLIYGRLYDYLFLIDVGFASVGYMLTLKMFDAHLRSAEPTLLGWVVCLMCYTPFCNIVGSQYLDYDSGKPWGFWFEGWPVLKLVWSLLILSCITIYALATVQFGIRFSNLAHRGIITNGPYRWLKHPAYVFKCLSFWLMWVPIFSTAGAAEALRTALLLVGSNLVYCFRAKTEEAHLMNDPIYREYAAFIQEHGLLGFVRRKMSSLYFRVG